MLLSSIHDLPHSEQVVPAHATSGRAVERELDIFQHGSYLCALIENGIFQKKREN